MSIETKVKLQPFRVPNYVIVDMPPRLRQEGMSEAPKYHLSELDNETLEELCRQFREDVFTKAKQSRNPRIK